MKKWTICFKIFFMFFVMSIFLMKGSSDVEAKNTLKMYSANQSAITKTATVQVEYYTTSKNYKPGSVRGTYRMYLTMNGQKTLIHDDVEYAFLSDGANIYYIVHGAYISGSDVEDLHKTTVYKYVISTGKKKKLASSTGLRFVNCAKSKYAYLTYQKKNYIWDQYGLFVLNLSNGKFKKLGDGHQSAVRIYKDRIVIFPSGGAMCYDYKIYSYKLNGTAKKSIAKGAFWGIKNGKIYYIQSKKGSTNIRGYRCNMLGKSKKAVTKWVSESEFPWNKIR